MLQSPQWFAPLVPCHAQRPHFSGRTDRSGTFVRGDVFPSLDVAISENASSRTPGITWTASIREPTKAGVSFEACEAGTALPTPMVLSQAEAFLQSVLAWREAALRGWVVGWLLLDHASETRIESVSEGIPKDVEAEYRDREGKAGEDRKIRCSDEELPGAAGQVRAPRRGSNRNANTEEAQS